MSEFIERKGNIFKFDCGRAGELNLSLLYGPEVWFLLPVEYSEGVLVNLDLEVRVPTPVEYHWITTAVNLVNILKESQCIFSNN